METTDQHTNAVVSSWDEFIEWERRAEGEGTFYVDQLRKVGAERVLDMACGTGYDSVRLLKAGFDVESSDGSPLMLTKAKENAERHGVNLKARVAEWSKLTEVYKGEKFDAVIALGNSFPTYVFDPNAQEKITAGVASLLKPKCLFIIDQRNYDKILDKGYSSNHSYVYCGKNFEVDVLKKQPGIIRFGYKREGQPLFQLELNPMRFGEVRSLLEKKFAVESYGDFKKIENLYEPDFFQHVGVKV